MNRHMGAERAQQHTPEYAKRLIQMYNQKGEIDARCELLEELFAYMHSRV